MTDADQPNPVRDADSAIFWQGLEAGEVRFQKCNSCGATQLYGRSICRQCWSVDVVWLASAGFGRIYSYTMVMQIGHPIFRAELPYLIGLVDIDEGPRVMARLVDFAREPEMGERVHVALRDGDVGINTLAYRPSQGSDEAADPDKSGPSVRY